MIPAPFDYHRPGTLDEAIGLLARYGAEAKVLSGGMSLLPTLKLRLGSYAHLVDINRIPGLEYIQEERGLLRIGAGTRQATLERSELIRTKYPILGDAVPMIADPLVRNRATLGGNLANGDPANDGPAIAIALGAELIVKGRGGERVIPANRFYKSLYTTELKGDEILIEIRIPVPPAKSGGAYRKLKRKTGDFAAAAVAVQLTLDARGAVERAGIALTNVGPTPIEAVKAQQFISGKTPDENNIPETARLAAQAASPSADRRGSVEYKREMARVLAARAIKTALDRAERS
ncbi:MAG TPA: xanthine dehydrogenase family protein subunit M [Burkholderiales bacterium]|nr:xanthine dehydrogenase family protein subunit M [Burkholderiales bacterium]